MSSATSSPGAQTPNRPHASFGDSAPIRRPVYQPHGAFPRTRNGGSADYFGSSPPRPSLSSSARTAASLADTTDTAKPSTKSIDGYGDLGPIHQSKPYAASG